MPVRFPGSCGPASAAYPSPEIVQNKTRVAFLYELIDDVSFHSRGRPRPSKADIEPSFFGNGIGDADGDTLVIDSIGFKEKLSWIDDDAHPA